MASSSWESNYKKGEFVDVFLNGEWVLGVISEVEMKGYYEYSVTLLSDGSLVKELVARDLKHSDVIVQELTIDEPFEAAFPIPDVPVVQDPPPAQPEEIKPKRFGSLREEDVRAMETSARAQKTLQQTGWGVKIFRDTIAEYCASESFDIGCAVDEAILMRSALYGRMKPGRCISGEYDHSIGCYSDVLHYMDSQCSGRQKCKILIATLEAVAQPCQKDFKSYLQATFRCVKVFAARTQTCQSDDMMTLTSPTGIIAGGVTHEMPELLTCRWAIRVRSGQSVALTLFSFDLITIDGMSDNRGLAEQGDIIDECSMQVSVHERQERTKIDVCNVRQREREIYQSENHIVHVEVVVHRSPRRPRFMIKYKATGCPDIEATGDTWMNRRGDHLFIRCNETNETWFLTCREDRWIGEMGNCTSDKSWTSEKVFGGNASFHRAWIVFAIIIGVVIGLLVGTSLLTIALMWRKRNRDHPPTPPCSIEDNCGQNDLAMSSSVNRPSFPALLRQEKMIGSDVSEYTHVWDVQAPVICQDAVPHHLHTCKLLNSGGDYSTYGNKDTCKVENNANMMQQHQQAASTYSRSGESGYESPTYAGGDDKPNVIPRNVPVYFDMDPAQLACPHGHTLTRITRTT